MVCVNLTTLTFVPINLVLISGPGSSVGIATGYGLDGTGSNPGDRRDFAHLSRPALGAYPASCKMGTGSFPGVNCGRGVTLTPSPSSSAVVKKE